MVTTPPAQRARLDEREHRLLDAARRILHERGFDADIRDILKLAGVGTGTAYRHFPNKEALVRAVIDEMVRQVQDGLAAARRIEDAREAVAATMRVGFRAVVEYGQLPVALFAGLEPPEYRGIVDREALGALFGALIRRGIEQGHFRADLDVEFAVAVWFALAAPNALSHLMEQQGRSVEEIAQLTTRFLLDGIRTRPA